MIRRGFWLAAGAVTGIYGYRRVSAIGRRLSASLNPARPTVGQAQEAMLGQAATLGQAARLGHGTRLARRGAIGLARETFRFTRDVREGMELYTARHSGPADPTLSTVRESAIRESAARESAARESTDHESTDHEPKDGH